MTSEQRYKSVLLKIDQNKKTIKEVYSQVLDLKNTIETLLSDIEDLEHNGLNIEEYIKYKEWEGK